MAHKFANECTTTTTREKESSFVPKSQLISKGLFGAIVLTKKQRNFKDSNQKTLLYNCNNFVK